MDIDAYLQRIAYTGPLDPGITTLRKLHRAHMNAVPFENLDIALKRPILLDYESLYNKIVRNNRGGFCYELNGLFAILLQELGFDVTYLSARVADGDGSFGQEFDHMVLLVKTPTEGKITSWLGDVGFGDSFLEPLPLDERREIPEELRAYRLDREGGEFTLWQKEYNGEWSPQYRFTLRPRRFSDYLEMCNYHQTSPNSIFTRNSICSLAIPGGRVSLERTRLIQTINGKRQEYPIKCEEEYRQKLDEIFKIRID